MALDIKGFLFSLVKPAAPSGSVNLPFQYDVNGPNVAVSVSAPLATASMAGLSILPIRKVVMVVDGGGSVPVTGAVKRFVQVDFAGTIVGWAAFGDQPGSATVDVWKKAGTAPPTATAPVIPTSSDKISASAPVAISSAQSAAGDTSSVSTWTTAVAAGDTFGFSIASVATLTAITIELYIQQG